MRRVGHGDSNLVTVTGALLVDADGTVQLCDAIAESLPPQCGGGRIEVQGVDLAIIEGLQEENTVRWAESVTLFGSVE